MSSLPDLYKDAQQIAGMLYFDFLEKQNVFALISSPIATERLFYELHWPLSAFKIGEAMLWYLSTFEIVNMQGGTVTLGRRSTFFKKNRIATDELVHTPMYHFVSYGLKKVSEIIDGDDAKWTLHDHLFTLEFGLIDPILELFRQEFRQVLKSFTNTDELPKLAFFGFHPEWFLSHLKSNIESPEQIMVYVKDEAQLKQAVDVAELNLGTSQFSKQIKIFDPNEIEEKYDFVFAYTAFISKLTFADNVNIVKKLLKKNGTLIYNAFSLIPDPSGVEPILLVIEAFEELIDAKYVATHLKADGFKLLGNNINTFFNYAIYRG